MSKGYKAVDLIFCAGIAFLVWTLAYGFVLGVICKDSRILNIIITENPFALLQQVWTYASNSTLQRVAIGALLPAIAAAVFASYLKLRRYENPLGDAAFQDVMGLRRCVPFQSPVRLIGGEGFKRSEVLSRFQ
ncbi:MAG: hypothetical protein ACTHLK_08570 [Brucella intermedia]